MKTKPEDAAFARPYSHDMQTGFRHTSGLTKREYFAAMAMEGLIKLDSDCTQHEIALDAVAQADSLIAALNKESAQ